MCRIKWNIIWRVLDIYDRAIIILMIINKYILYVYLYPWKILFCNLRFLEVYNNIHPAVKME